MTCEFLRAAFRMQLLSWSSPAFSEIRRALVDLLWDIPESSTITKIITKWGVTSILNHSSQSINSFFAGNRQKNNLKQLPEKRQGEFFARLAALSDKEMHPTPKTRHGIKIMQHSWHLLRIIPGMKKYEECRQKTKTCLISCHSVIVKGDMLHSTAPSWALQVVTIYEYRVVSCRINRQNACRAMLISCQVQLELDPGPQGKRKHVPQGQQLRIVAGKSTVNITKPLYIYMFSNHQKRIEL